MATTLTPAASPGDPSASDEPKMSAPPGTEEPGSAPELAEPAPIHRTFAFADLCGFTRYLEKEGAVDATELLTEFRTIARDIAGRRGVRIAKWLGDGVLFVGVDAGPVVATVVELTARMEVGALRLRAGVATGTCLLFEADDYIGGPINLASRLTDAARPGEVLADENTASVAPEWIEVGRLKSQRLEGLGKVRGISPLRLSGDVHIAA